MLKSKTFWTGLGTVGFGIYLVATGDTTTGVQTISVGLGMIFLKHAVAKK